jgi:hypothetical protein
VTTNLQSKVANAANPLIATGCWRSARSLPETIPCIYEDTFGSKLRILPICFFGVISGFRNKAIAYWAKSTSLKALAALNGIGV